jgi:hypothetical protein
MLCKLLQVDLDVSSTKQVFALSSCVELLFRGKKKKQTNKQKLPT